ncbi:MAG UNVERIFIED_CONTAM: hypothetical protein LOD86_02950 [Thermobifida fusca]
MNRGSAGAVVRFGFGFGLTVVRLGVGFAALVAVRRGVADRPVSWADGPSDTAARAWCGVADGVLGWVGDGDAAAVVDGSGAEATRAPPTHPASMETVHIRVTASADSPDRDERR